MPRSLSGVEPGFLPSEARTFDMRFKTQGILTGKHLNEPVGELRADKLFCHGVQRNGSLLKLFQVCFIECRHNIAVTYIKAKLVTGTCQRL